MWNAEKKVWLSDPPTYGCIMPPGTTSGSNLDAFIDMTDNTHGQIVNLSGLLEQFCPKKQERVASMVEEQSQQLQQQQL